MNNYVGDIQIGHRMPSKFGSIAEEYDAKQKQYDKFRDLNK